jgi:hypothetical protein
MQHEMPKPSAEHQRLLAAMTGSWTSEETIFPSPWGPGGKRTGRAESRAACDGFFAVTDYEQMTEGKVSYRGHGVYGYDGTKKCWSMHWFDSMGGMPAHLVWGNWEGDTLTFAISDERGHHRYVYAFQKDGSYVFAIGASQDGKVWKTFMEGKFTRRK